MSDKQNDISLSTLKITLIYVVVAALWIAYTDHLLELVVSDPNYLSTLQTYKGWLYVFLTAVGLFFLIKEHDNQLQSKKVELDELLENLRSEQELSSILFDRIPVLITMYDPDLNEFDVNKEFENVIGWSNEDIKEQDIDLMEECFPGFEEQERAADFMDQPGVGWKEFTMETRAGDKIPTSWTNIKLTDETSVGIGIDMTEIKASQAKIRESQKLLKKTFESLKSSLIILDYKSRTIIDCNKSTEELFGYSKEELEGSSTRKLHVSDEKFEEFNEMGAAALAEKGVFQTEFVMQKKDGSTFYSDHIVTFVYDEDGEVDKVVSVVRDISDRKKNELELKRRQERLLRSQKIGEIGDWELNPKTKEISWSATMFEIYERDPELGAPSYDEIQTNYYEPSVVKHNKAIEGAIEKKESYDIDLQLKTDKGNKKFVRAIIVPKENEEGEVVKLLGIVQDITERKISQKKLEQRNTFIEKTLDNLPIGVAVNTIDDGKTTLMNKKFAEIYGWPQDVLKNVETFFEKVYPDEEYRAKIVNQVQEDIESGDPERMQWNNIRITTQEDDQKIVNTKNIPLYEQNLMISTVMDVTEQKELEKELEKEKQRFKLVADTTSDIIWDLDFRKKELWWSEGFEEVLGYERQTLKENFQKWSDYIHPDDKEKITESSEQALNSGSRKWEEEYRLIKADGSIAHMVDRAIIIRDGDGKAIRMVGTMDDITERRRAQQKLRKSEEKYRHLFKNNPEPMWIYNPKTLEFVEVNQAAIEHYGYSEKEFLDMTLADIRPPEEIEAMKKDVKQHRGQESYSEEWIHTKKDGTNITVEISAADVLYNNETYRLVLVNDITQQKRVQEKIIQSVIEGEDRERKRIAHELHDGLGQYLVAANMNFESAKGDLEEMSDKRQQQFETGLSLLKNALSETRSIAYNLMPKAIADYGLITALENLVQDFKKSTDIVFHLNHNCEDLRLKNQAEINIYRIFQEIISNAVRHAECSLIDIKLQLKKDTLTIVIEDDGKGADLNTQQDHVGLGLTSIETRVNNLKGDLNVDSEPGQGMKTTIVIPEIADLKLNDLSDG